MREVGTNEVTSYLVNATITCNVILILNATLYPVHVQKNTPQFMTALFSIGRIWLGAATILPQRHIDDLDDTNIQDQDNFSTFRPKCTRYNPPVAPGSYVSRFTSHIAYEADYPSS